MPDLGLRSRRILVVEDEFMLADELAQELTDAGASVIGPVPSVDDALALLAEQAPPDGAILDVNLGGQPVFPLADTLIDRGVPLVFTTGYDRGALPERYEHVPTCEKPINVLRVVSAIGKVCEAAAS